MISLILLAGTLLVDSANKDTVWIDENPSCSDCTVVIDKPISLRRADDPNQFAMLASVFYSTKGHFILGPVGKDNRIEIYDSVGKQTRIIPLPDSFGDEPLLPPQIRVTPGDTLHVFGIIPPFRHLVLTLEGKEVRRGTLPLPTLTLVFFPNGSFVFSGAINTPTAIGHPFHQVNVSGQVQRSFGVGRQPFLTSLPDRLNRQLALADSGRFWAGHPSGAVIEVWDTSGRVQRTFIRAAIAAKIRQFDSLGSQPGIDADTLPLPQLRRIVQDESRLWIFTTVPNTQWQPSISDEELIKQGRPVPSIEEEIGDGPARFNTRIDLMDLKTNRIITSQTHPGAILPIGAGYIATISKDKDGHWTYIVGHLRLRTSTKE